MTCFWPHAFSIRLHEITRFEIEIPSIFEAPTIAELAERIETSIHAGASQTPLPIARAPRQNGVVPASFVQERVWELKNFLPELPVFNILYALRVTSPCDVAVLERSINEIVRRHEILRTTFTTVDGRCMQVIAPELTVPLTFDDLRALPAEKIEAAVHEFVREELSHAFVLECSPLIRTRLVRLAERSHLLLIAMAGMIEDASINHDRVRPSAVIAQNQGVSIGACGWHTIRPMALSPSYTS